MLERDGDNNTNKSIQFTADIFNSVSSSVFTFIFKHTDYDLVVKNLRKHQQSGWSKSRFGDIIISLFTKLIASGSKKGWLSVVVPRQPTLWVLACDLLTKHRRSLTFANISNDIIKASLGQLNLVCRHCDTDMLHLHFKWVLSSFSSLIGAGKLPDDYN